MLSAIGNIRDVKVVVAIANRAVEEEEVLEELLSILVNGITREQYIASWILSRVVEIEPDILNESAHNACLKIIHTTKEGGIKRNLIRVWQFSMPESEAIRLEILDLAFKLLSDTAQDVAVRVFAITVLEKLLRHFPEIKEEVLFLLEREYPQATPSFKVRADRFIKSAGKL
ncbi:MAG: hypothetical protein ACKOXF_10755 [Chitinophagaceae bacterium]